MKTLLRCLLLASLALTASCTGPTVTLDLRFPSQVGFVAASLIDVEVVPLAPDALGRCPALLADVLAGTQVNPSLSVPGVPRCDVLHGVALPDPGGGPHAFIVQALSQTNAILLAGCAVGEAYPGGPPIRVDLYPTDAYAAVASGVPPGSTAEGACP